MQDLNKAILHITGTVQGVGFRPFVYELATRFRLKGWVRNTSSGVDIELDGEKSVLDVFIQILQSELPPLARIDKIETKFEEPGLFTSFDILQSEREEGAYQPISPDVSICPDCLKELFDSSNRRYRYPFINCTNCGPRFTIIQDIPYDRPNTTMAKFPMCKACSWEYHDPSDRRFHAQPIACPVCGPQVWLELNNGVEQARGDVAIRASIRLLAEGKILAIKGLGGFHLACDATNKRAVSELRNRKLRAEKPFAVMMADLPDVREHCHFDINEQLVLLSRQRPIVILKRKSGSSIVDEISPKQNTIGVMLPYTPLHYLLMPPGEGQNPPLVMTSGNLSEEPIAIDNREARQRLSSLADGFLMHDREIYTRCDDSVGRVILVDNQGNHGANPIQNYYFIRRSRGFAPEPINIPIQMTMALAVGSDLKNTFAYSRDEYAFISHHNGDLENYETYLSFESGIGNFEKLFRIKPEAIFHDLHPDYLSSNYATERAQKESLTVIPIQHHHAHIAACMADNLLPGDEPVIGLAFDGTGFGVDRAIWGGEVFVADYHSFVRKYHLAYFPLPGGDNSIKNPIRTALSLLWSLGYEWDETLSPVIEMDKIEQRNLQIQLERRINTPLTSSMGRLFDSVSSLIGIKHRISYEAQAAIEFEAAVDEAETGSYKFEIHDDLIFVGKAIRELLADVHSGVSKGIISARFHNGLVEVVRSICDGLRSGINIDSVVLSGGVWQNMVLLERTIIALRSDGFKVYKHINTPTNDGGISLGQLMIGINQLGGSKQLIKEKETI